MKRYLLIIFLAIVCVIPVMPTPAQAASLVIQLGDRPYYHGPYWWGPRHERLFWVPGHWVWRRHHRIWVHGHYVRRW